MREENIAEEEMQKLSKVIESSIPSKGNCSSNGHECAFSKQANQRLESENRSTSARKLGGLIVFCIIFIVVEIVGGVKANSLAVITDAAHLLTDVLGFSISLFTVWASGWDATPRHSFGFFRLEVLGALFSVQLIWLIIGIIMYEAIDRILNKSEVVNGKLMFVTAAFGFVINIIMVTWLGHNHIHHSCSSKEHDHGVEHPERITEGEMTSLVPSHIHDHHCEIEDDHNVQSYTMFKWMQKLKQKHVNMNVQGAYLHVLGDLIQSIGVMIGGAVIWAKPDWLLVDLICTLAFSVLVLFTTVSMVRNVLVVLMESTPSEIDVEKIETDLKCIEGVRAVHDLHVWAMSVERLLLLCHITTEPGVNSKEILHKTRDYCENVHGIHHVTVQIEPE